MSDLSVFDVVAGFGVVPIIAIDDVEAALPLADALIEGGLPIAEITFRTEAAAEVLKMLHAERPKLLLGAGTVLTAETAKAAKDCGAQFAVAPGLNPAVVAAARDVGLPFAPGIATPSDIEGALSLDCRVLKVFPAGALGGVDALKSISAPYAHLGVRYVPTGGVNAENMNSYLNLPSVAAVGGTWIAKKDDLAQGRWDEISQRCRAAMEAVAAVRG